MQEKPLGYDLLLAIDAIRAFGGVMITAAGGVTLGRGKEVCAAISIEEKDFCATFDNKERAWTARWKWAMNKAPDQLCNTIFLMQDESTVKATSAYVDDIYVNEDIMSADAVQMKLWFNKQEA